MPPLTFLGPVNTGDIYEAKDGFKKTGFTDTSFLLAGGGTALVSNFATYQNIATYYYTKTQLQTSGQSQVNWGNLTDVPATFPATAHNHDDRYYTETESDGRFIPKLAHAIGYGSVIPTQIEPGFTQIGAVSYNNDGSYPFGDYILFGGEGHLGGGMGWKNLVMFNKMGFGMRQYLAPVGQTTRFTEYADYWHTGNLASPIQETIYPLATDFNLLRTKNIRFEYGWGAANQPVDTGAGHISTFNYDTNLGVQQFHSFYTNDLYLRNRNSGAYSTWKKVWHEGNDTALFDKLKVGVVNLLLTTGNKNWAAYYSDSGDRVVTNSADGRGAKIVATFGNVYWSLPKLETVEGEEYIVSFDYKSTTGFGIYFYDPYYYTGGGINTNGVWKKYIFKYTKDASQVSNVTFGFHSFNGEIEFKNLKLERGNKATDWIPSLEEMTSDWNQTNPLAFNYIRNKPDIDLTTVHAIHNSEGDSFAFNTISKTQIGSVVADGNYWHHINIRHRNGVSDGISWAGQIRFGMTSQQDVFQYRTQTLGNWESTWRTFWHDGNFNPANYIKLNSSGGIANGSGTGLVNALTNTFWFDYNWANTGRLGSVINFSGLNNGYSTEVFASYNTYYTAIRSRSGDNLTWNEPMVLWHDKNFNPESYVLQSALNTQLLNYVTTAGVQDITATKTFTVSPIVPIGTLASHAVNLGQLNTKSDVGHTHSLLLDDITHTTLDLDTLVQPKGIRFNSQFIPAGNNVLPAIDSDNAVLTISTWTSGIYGHQLGFSSNGNIYHRYGRGAWQNWNAIATQSWITSQGYLTSASLTGYATENYVNTAISNLVDSSPATLDTLNELAAALGDDPNFATTMTNLIGTKENAFSKNTAFNKNFGTSAGEVAEGNHTHTIAQVTGLQGALDGKVDDSQVLTNVPAGAVFTDTTYSNGTGLSLSGTQFSIQNDVMNDIALGKEANSWGDHSQVGYLTGFSETDPTVPTWVKSITQANISEWQGKVNRHGDTMTGGLSINPGTTQATHEFKTDHPGGRNDIYIRSDNANVQFRASVEDNGIYTFGMGPTAGGGVGMGNGTGFDYLQLPATNSKFRMGFFATQLPAYMSAITGSGYFGGDVYSEGYSRSNNGFVHDQFDDPGALLVSDGSVVYAEVDVINNAGELRIQPAEITSSGVAINCSITYKHKLIYIRVRGGNKISLSNPQPGQRFILFNVDGDYSSDVEINSSYVGTLSPYTKISLYISNLGERLFYDKGEIYNGGF